MYYASKFMFNTIYYDNHVSVGVEDEVIHSLYSSELPAHTSVGGATDSTRDVLGKEFLCIQEAEGNYHKGNYHKYSYFKGFSVRKDDLRLDKNGLITVRRWVCSKEGIREKKYVE
ncbi:hypothetical protein ACOSQ2_026954 [Xanthoceras sorbifolium]